MGRQGQLSAVLDTNVLLGIHRRILLRLAFAGIFTLVWSDYIAEEVNRKFREMRWGQVKATQLFKLIDTVAIKVDHREITGGNYDEWLLDLDDHPIIATAIIGRADYLVTANTKHFPPKKRFANITIITPEAFIQLIQS